MIDLYLKIKIGCFVISVIVYVACIIYSLWKNRHWCHWSEMVGGIFIRIFRKNIIFYDLYKNEIAMPALNMSACTMSISKHDIYMTMIKKWQIVVFA